MKYRVKTGVLLAVAVIAIGTLFTLPPIPKPPVEIGDDKPASPQISKPTGPIQQIGKIFANDDRSDDMPWFTEKADIIYSVTKTSKQLPTRPAVKSDVITINDKTYPVRTYQMLMTPNDPLVSQWWLAPSGTSSAWDIAAGSYQTTVAIIDSGFALEHEEFVGRWALNTGEQGAATTESVSRLNCSARSLSLNYSCNLVDDDVDGIVDNESGVATYENPSQLNCTSLSLPLDKSCNILDDDANGYTDDVRGWDMINQDRSVQTGQLSPTGSATSHGTMVTGIAAATGNNGVGVAGIDWRTKILPIQALDDDGYGNTKSVGDAIYYAVSRDVDIINISLGTEYHDEYVRDAVEAATAAGIVVVASSGNDGCECIVYPARYPEVVAVGALDSTNNRASFSSWGEALDIVAPGASMTSTSWSSGNPTSRYSAGIAGTSFSSPFIAGVAALLKSNRPTAEPLHIISALRETANRQNNTPVYLPNAYYGYGKVNTAVARQRLVTPKNVVQSYVFSPVSAGNYFTGQIPTESASTYRVRECEGTGTSVALYELKNASSSFYTISETEARRASNLGYNSTRFAYTCMAQPHDTSSTIRTIDIFREFKNLVRKP